LLSKKKQDIDEDKAYTLEEYSKLCIQIKENIRENQMKYTPIINQHEGVKKEYDQIVPVYNQKKQIFDVAMTEIMKEHNKLKEEYSKYELEFKNAQNKYYQLQFQTKINDDMLKRYDSENTYLTKQDKSLNKEFKSYTDYYKIILSEQDKLIKDLKEQQKATKASSEDAAKQVIYFPLVRLNFSQI
jgi:hypothetical protein